MALSAADFRNDLLVGNNKKLKCGPTSKPCGNACIPKGHKCRASWNKPIKAAAAVGGAAAVGITATAFFHPRARARNAARGMVEPAMQAGFGVGNIARGNRVGAAKNFLNVAVTGKDLGKNARTLAQEYGTDLKSAKNLIRNRFFKAKHHRRAKGGRVPGLHYDSLELTAGDFRSDKKCGASGIPENAKCTKGVGKAASGEPKRNILQKVARKLSGAEKRERFEKQHAALKKKHGANSPEAWGGERLNPKGATYKWIKKNRPNLDPDKIGANSPLAMKIAEKYV